MAAARALVGAPWRHCGRTPQGVDCIGLLIMAAEAAGGPRIAPEPYSREDQTGRLTAGLQQYCEQIDRAAPARAVEIGEFAFPQEAFGRHVGIVLTGAEVTILHAYLPLRKVIETALDADILARRIRRWRLADALCGAAE